MSAFENRFEIGFITILLLGIIFSLLLNNLGLHLITIFVFGMIVNTFQEMKKFELNFPYVLLIIGFVVGFLIATKSGYRWWLIISFIAGIVAGKYLKKFIIEKMGSKLWFFDEKWRKI